MEVDIRGVGGGGHQRCRWRWGIRGVGGGGHQRCKWRWASEV